MTDTAPRRIHNRGEVGVGVVLNDRPHIMDKTSAAQDEMTTHADHKFSVTISTGDLAVVNCLRALAKFSQRQGNNSIPTGGTKDEDWRRDGRRVTFRFSKPQYRDRFMNELERLLPSSLWSVAGKRDDDPATPQRR